MKISICCLGRDLRDLSRRRRALQHWRWPELRLDCRRQLRSKSPFRAALERLNPALPPEAITAAVDELTRDRSAMSLEAANRVVYLLLKEGIRVSVAERDSTPGHTSSGLRPPSPQRGEGKGGQTTVRVRVIDWEQPANNDFLLVSQFSVTGALYTCRPDLVGFVNGLPLVVIELKKPGVPARAAFDENLTHYNERNHT